MLPQNLPHMHVVAIVTSKSTFSPTVEFTESCDFGFNLKRGDKLLLESDVRAVINVYKEIIIELTKSNCSSKKEL